MVIIVTILCINYVVYFAEIARYLDLASVLNNLSNVIGPAVNHANAYSFYSFKR